MYCKKCGQEIDNDSTFCSSCGNKVKSISDLHNVELEFDTITDNPVPTKNKKKKNGKVIGLAVVIIIAVSIFLVMSPPTPRGVYKNTYGDTLIFRGNMFSGYTFSFYGDSLGYSLGGSYKPKKTNEDNVVILVVDEWSNFESVDGHYNHDKNEVMFASYSDNGLRSGTTQYYYQGIR